MSGESIPETGSGRAGGETVDATLPGRGAADIEITTRDEAIPATTGARIKYHCDQSGLSHTQLASRLGQSYAWLVRVFRNDFQWLRDLDDGCHPDPRPAERPQLWRCAEALGVEVAVLLGRPLRDGTEPSLQAAPAAAVAPPASPPIPAAAIAARSATEVSPPTGDEQVAEPAGVAAASMATTPEPLDASVVAEGVGEAIGVGAGRSHPGGSRAAGRPGGAAVRRAGVGAATVGALRLVALKICAPKIALAAAAGLAIAAGVVGEHGAAPGTPVPRLLAPALHGSGGGLAIGPRGTQPPRSGGPVASAPTPATAVAASPPTPPEAPTTERATPVPPPVAAAPARVERAARVQPAGPIATLSATSIDFGAVRAGATVSRTVTLTNTGSTPLHLGVPIVFMETDLTTATDCTGRTLAPGQHCSITETFQPGGGPVRLHATVFLTDDAPSGREEIDVRGTST